MRTCALFLASALCALSAAAQEPPKPAADNAELAKKLANPIGALISVPFQNNMDVGIGEANGSRNTMNFQPIVPFRLSESYSLITRYIVPLMIQHDIPGPGTQNSGLGDTLVSGWISNAKVKNGVVWGLGGAFLVPTATDDALGRKKFAAGPTAILLRQANGWTYGALINQIWSGGDAQDTKVVNQAYAQPFVTYNWKSSTTHSRVAPLCWRAYASRAGSSVSRNRMPSRCWSGG